MDQISMNFARGPTWGQPAPAPSATPVVRRGGPTRTESQLRYSRCAAPPAHGRMHTPGSEPRHSCGSGRHTVVPGVMQEANTREVPRRARRPRRRRRLGRSQPPGPTQRPGAGRPADRDRDGGDGLELSHVRLRDLGPRHRARRRRPDEGRALVSGRLLADICRSLPAKPVEMTIDGAKVSLTCGSARFSLQTMPVEEYPSLPDMPEATGTVRSDAVRQRRRPGGHRRRPRRHAAGADRRPDRDRRSDHRRCSPPTGSGSRCASSTGTRARPTSRRPPWSRPGCSPTPRSRSPPAPR